MDAALKKRAQAVAAMANRSRGFTPAEFKEIEEVYRLVIGHHKDCYSCVVYGLIGEISKKLIQQPLKIKDMANAKGQFKHNAASTQIIRHGKTGTIVITEENLNQADNFEFAAKNYPHLVQETKTTKADSNAAEDGAPKLTPKQQLQAEYLELYGEAADERTTSAQLSELIAAKK